MRYEEILENLIMDDLMPMYLVGCRSSGVNPRQNEIIAKLLEAKESKREIPWLLKKDSAINPIRET